MTTSISIYLKHITSIVASKRHDLMILNPKFQLYIGQTLDQIHPSGFVGIQLGKQNLRILTDKGN